MSTLRPWRSHDRSNTLTDRAVVAFLADDGPARPRDVARSRYRENVIRLQCRYLERLGVLSSVAADAWQTVPRAWETFEDCLESGSSAYVDASLALPEGRRIADLSGVEPDLFEKLNREFFSDGAYAYGHVRGDRELTARRIRNVPDYRLARFVREFPRTETLCRQCAHWVRGLVGLHFFPDANHRTAMGTLYAVLDANDLTPVGDWPFEWVDVAVVRSKLLRGYHCDVRFDTLWERDELYHHWLRYFRDNLLQTDRRPRNERGAAFLDDVLEFARNRNRRL